MEPKIILLLTLVSGALAGPVAYEASRSCAHECSSDGIQKFKYKVGKKYVYDYEISTETSLNSGGDTSSFKLASTVEIGRLSSCEFILRMKNVRLQDETQPRERDIKENLEKYSLRFAFHDGRIDHICPNDDESTWILNLKRGVLSAFQNSMENFKNNQKIKETDIAGDCHVDYIVNPAINGWIRHQDLTITKVKNLRSCTNRHGNQTATISNPYWIESDFQNLPVVDGQHSCKHVVKNDIIKTILCEETHTFKPFTRQNSGAATKAKLTMEYKSEEPDQKSSMSYVSQRLPLLFDHSYISKDQEENREDRVVKVLKEICDETQQDVTERTPQLFINLVSEMRQSDLNTLQSVDQSLETACADNVNKINKVFRDALPMTNTPAAVEIMVSKIVSKEVNGLEAQGWVLAMNFIPQVNQRMITAVKPLLEMNELIKTAVLSVSSMVRMYTKNKPTLLQDPEVVSVIELLVKKLNYKCRANSQEERETIVVTLKALGNMAVNRNIVHQCYKEPSNPLEIRIAAIEALRLVKLPEEGVLPLLEIFENTEESTEVRIAAYETVMRTPNKKIIERIKTTLEKEEINQVSSFVWTHLTNIQESSSPQQILIQEILNDVKLSQRYDMDGRKYSRYFEKSMFSNLFNVGGRVSGKVVFDQSYLPRSANTELDVELFGNRVNLFGVGLRSANLESLFESVFGPQGYFPQNTIQDILKMSRSTGDRKREKMSADNSFNRLDLFYERFAPKREEPEGSVYFRLFDRDILYGSFLGLDDLKSLQEKMKAFNILTELAKEKDIDYNKNIIFLESTHISPCLGGLPIKLSVNGTASVNVKISGKADVQKLISSRPSAHIEGKISPSAAVQISVMMGIDSYTYQSGIKVKSIFSSSVDIDGKFVVSDGEVLESYMNFPREKMNIFKMSSEVFVVHRHEEKPQRKLENKRLTKKLCTNFNFVDLQFCGQVSLINTWSLDNEPHFPLAGPASVEIYLEKTDPNLSQIKLEGKWINTKNPKTTEKFSQDIMLSLSTPNTKIQREIKVELKITKEKNGFLASVRTPKKKVSLEGTLVNEGDLKRAKLVLNLDEDREYAVQAQVQIDKKSYSTVYTPSFELSLPKKKPITLQGTVTYVKSKKLNVDLTLKEVTQQPVSLKVDMERKVNGDINSNLTFNSYLLSGTAKGVLYKQKGTYTTQIDVQYRTSKSTKLYRVTVNAKLNNLSTGTLTNIKTNFDLRSTQYPEYNTLLKWDHQWASKHLENRGEIRFGQDQTDKNKLEIIQILSRNNGIQSSVKVTYPKKNIDANLNINYQTTSSSISANLQAQYAANKNAGLKLAVNNYKKSPLRGDVDLTMFYLDQDVRVKGKVEEYSSHQYKIDGSITYQKDQSLAFIVHLKNKTSNIKNNYELVGTFTPPSGIEYGINLVSLSQNGLISYSTYLEKQGQRTYGMEYKISYQKDQSAKAEVKVVINREESVLQANYAAVQKQKYEVTLDWSSPNNKAQIVGNVNFQGDKYSDPLSTKLKVDINGDILEMTTASEFKFIKDNRKLQLDMSLTTPFKQLEEFILKCNYYDDGRKANGLISSTWNNDKEIKLSLVGNYAPKPFEVSGKLEFDSSYTDPIIVESTYSYNGIRIDSKIKYKYGDYIKTIQLSGKYINNNRQDIQLTGKLLTGENTRPDYTVSVTYNADSRSKKTEIKLISDKDTTVFKNDISKENEKRYSGKTSLQTTLPQISNFEVKYTIETSPNKVVEKIEALWGRNLEKKYVHDLELLIDHYKKIEGKLFMEAPSLWEDPVEVKIKFNNDTYLSKGDLEIKWNLEKEIALNYRINKEKGNIKEASLTIRSPYENYEDVKINIKCTRDDKISTKAELQLGLNRKIEIQTDYRFADIRNFDASFSIDSDFYRIDNLHGRLSIDNDNDNYKGKAEYGYNSKNFLTELNHRSQKNPCVIEGSLILETPYTSLRSAKINYEHKHERNNNIRNKLLIEVNEQEKVYLEIKDDTSDKNGRSGSIILRNPLQPLSGSYVYASKSYLTSSNLKFNGEINLGNNNDKRLKFAITGEKEVKALKATVLLELSPKKRVNYEMALDWNNKYNGLIKMEYPGRSLAFRTQNEKIQSKIITLAEFKWDAENNDKKKISYHITHEYENLLSDNIKCRTTMIIATPVKDIHILTTFSSNEQTPLDLHVESESPGARAKIFTLDVKTENNALNSVSGFNYSASINFRCHEMMTVTVQSHIANNPDRATTRMALSLLDSSRKKHGVEMWGELNKNDRTVYALMKTNKNTYEASGNVDNPYLDDGDILKINLDVRIDGKKEGEIEMFYDKNIRLIDVKIRYDLNNNKMVQVIGQLINKNFARMELFFNEKGKRVDDWKLGVKFNGQNTQILWDTNSPPHFKEIQRYYDEVVKKAGEFSKANLEKLNHVKESASTLYKEVRDDVNKILSELKVHYNIGKKYLEDYYSEYLSNIVQNARIKVKDTSQYIENYLKKVKEQISDTYNDYRDRFQEKFEYYKNRISEYLNDFYEEYEEQILEFRRQWIIPVVNAIRNLGSLNLEKYTTEFRKRITSYYDSVKERVQNSIDQILDHPVYKKVQDLLASLPDHAKTMQKATASYILNAYNYVTGKLYNYREKLSDKYNELKYNLQNIVDKYVKELLKREELKYLIDKYKELTEDLNLQDALQTLADSVSTSTSKFMETYIKPRYSNFDIKNGKFEIYQPVPIDLNSLDTTIINKYVDYAKEKYNDYKDYSVWDTFYKYKPSSDIRNWIPPFKAFAMLGGNQHYITFDGKSYEFAGECSYLLASDFIDQNFTIIAKYIRQGILKSVVVMIENTQIEIFMDGKIKINGKHSELPYRKDDVLSISREENIVMLSSQYGITLRYLITHKIFTLEMAGWYFGKTGGLFGTYDNEQSTDFMKHDRQKTTDVMEFAKSWNVDDSCDSSVNYAKPLPSDKSVRPQRYCDELFQKSVSSLRYAFKQLNPQPYLEMCLRDASDFQNKVEEETPRCTPSIMYVEMSQLKHSIPLNPSKECVVCKTTEGKTMKEPEKIENNTPTSADVVILIEEKSSNKEFVSKLDELVKRLENELNKKHLTKNRYTIIGFGGKQQVHHLTSDGEIFSSDRLIGRAANNIVFDDSKTPSDAFMALKKAADLSFRPGVAKVALLVMSTDCEENEISYGDIKRILLQHDITLHTLTKKDLIVKGKSQLSNILYGISAKSAYTKKDDKSVPMGDKDLFKQVSVPKDICIALAQETNGTMFSLDKLYSANSADAKIFLAVLAKRVAEEATPARCQICECVLHHGYTGKTVCRLCNIPEPVLIQESAGDSREEVEKATKAPHPTKPAKKPPKKPLKKSFRPSRIEDEEFFNFFADDFDWMQ